MTLSYVTGLLLKNKKEYKEYIADYPVKGILGYFALALALYGCSCLFRPEKTGWALALNTLLLVLFLAVIVWDERALFRNILRRKA